jgi:SAM-dependent methyltransferase
MTATSNWSEGYAIGAAYLHEYVQDLNPRFAAFALLLQGLDGPPPGPCCEIGFGQGLSLALHAAGDPSRRWWGCDFMPGHAAHARDLVAAAGVDATVTDDSFEEFFARPDLPQFAFIGLHGVWSWISAANRERIVGFLRRHLLPGGVAYISYNTLPGWAALLPLRELMRQHRLRMSPVGGRDETRKALDALAFVQRVLAADPQVVAQTPHLRERVADWAEQPASYLLHELLSDHGDPMTFAQMAAELDAAKLSYACSSDLHDRRPDLQLTPQQQVLLDGIADRPLRESTRDTFTARRFRREYWLRGARPLSSAEATGRLHAQRVVLAVGRAELPGVLQGERASYRLPVDQMELAAGMLEAADAPLEIGRILDQAAARGIDTRAITELLAAWVGAGSLLLAASEAEVQAARPATQRLNARLTAAHAHRAGLVHLASPLSGGGVRAPAALQMMLGARAAAPRQPELWPGLLWDAMQAEGQQLMQNGQRITERAAAVAVLQPKVRTLLEQSLPLLRRLGVAE